MQHNTTKKIFLTFDVEGLPPKEDRVDGISLMCLRSVLDLLEEFGFKATFFLPASVAEQLGSYPEFIERMSRHRIGYHGAVHSVRPMILEYTDVPNYKTAIELSIKRETSRINLESGEIAGSGGLLALKKVFSGNDIVCFRAPFLAWSPPHLVALRHLGVRFDFSSYVLDRPANFKGITFYPGPIPVDGILGTIVNRMERKLFPEAIESLLLRRRVSVLLMHPSSLVGNKYYFVSGREKGFTSKAPAKLSLCLLRFLFERINLLQKSNLVEVTSQLNDQWEPLCTQSVDLSRIYWSSIKNPLKKFQYKPQHTYKHFVHFFD